MADQVKCQIAIAEDEELVVAELALFNQTHPLVAVQHVEHLVNFSPKNKRFPKFRLKSENWVAFVNFDEVELPKE